jgi:hypothetical protein
MPTNSDPLNVNARLYSQLGKLLDDMESLDRDEKMSMPQRIQALIAVGRIQVLFNSIRKGAIDDGTAGSTVRKYAAAFASKDGTRRRTSNARPVIVDDGGDDDGDPDAA